MNTSILDLTFHPIQVEIHMRCLCGPCFIKNWTRRPNLSICHTFGIKAKYDNWIEMVAKPTYEKKNCNIMAAFVLGVNDFRNSFYTHQYV